VPREIFSDAILAMLRASADEVNGLIDTDGHFLRHHGMSDFSGYSAVPGASPRPIMPSKFPVLEVAGQDGEGRRVDSTKLPNPNSKLQSLSWSFDATAKPFTTQVQATEWGVVGYLSNVYLACKHVARKNLVLTV
jgi:hypothetical protein